jgi:hypothetical protein
VRLVVVHGQPMGLPIDKRSIPSRTELPVHTIVSDDALILPHRANPFGWNSREPQVSQFGCFRCSRVPCLNEITETSIVACGHRPVCGPLRLGRAMVDRFLFKIEQRQRKSPAEAGLGPDGMGEDGQGRAIQGARRTRGITEIALGITFRAAPDEPHGAVE